MGVDWWTTGHYYRRSAFSYSGLAALETIKVEIKYRSKTVSWKWYENSDDVTGSNLIRDGEILVVISVILWDSTRKVRLSLCFYEWRNWWFIVVILYCFRNARDRRGKEWTGCDAASGTVSDDERIRTYLNLANPISGRLMKVRCDQPPAYFTSRCVTPFMKFFFHTLLHAVSQSIHLPYTRKGTSGHVQVILQRLRFFLLHKTGSKSFFFHFTIFILTVLNFVDRGAFRFYLSANIVASRCLIHVDKD